ncbi:hypothetical protein T492DRAFT_885289 [Pavlovales sp. CCMP2436]|nr:hypothetical protein T492DRAFT_885289 [Pavlovales sp. CCMP2436]
MFIKQVILEGFKVYKERVEIDLNNKHNCVGPCRTLSRAKGTPGLAARACAHSSISVVPRRYLASQIVTYTSASFAANKGATAAPARLKGDMARAGSIPCKHQGRLQPSGTHMGAARLGSVPAA